MNPQAVRRSPLFFRLRTWWRGLALADALDATAGAGVFLLYLALAIIAPELLK